MTSPCSTRRTRADHLAPPAGSSPSASPVSSDISTSSTLPLPPASPSPSPSSSPSSSGTSRPRGWIVSVVSRWCATLFSLSIIKRALVSFVRERLGRIIWDLKATDEQQQGKVSQQEETITNTTANVQSPANTNHLQQSSDAVNNPPTTLLPYPNSQTQSTTNTTDGLDLELGLKREFAEISQSTTGSDNSPNYSPVTKKTTYPGDHSSISLDNNLDSSDFEISVSSEGSLAFTCDFNSTAYTANEGDNSKMELLRSHLLSSHERQEHASGTHAILGQHGIANDQLVLVYNLELNAFNKSKLFRCEKFNRVRFHLAPSLYGHNVILYTNYCDDYTQFERETYSEVEINDPRNMLQLSSSGSFHFYYTEAHKNKVVLGSFYIVVNPELTIYGGKGTKSQILDVNAIQCQTSISKLMGPIDTWNDKLKVTIESGYNMIHWTPIQELGASRSAYSLANQHRINPAFRSKSMIEANQDCTLADVAKIVTDLREQSGVLSVTDIVLNHTANESAWLTEHPEAAYNCHNAPWLRPAFLLDRLFWHLTLDIEDDRWLSRGLSTEVTTEEHLNILRWIFTNEYLPMINFEEFYLCNEEKVVEDFEHFLIKFIYGEGVCKGDLDTAPILNHPSKACTKYNKIEIVQDPHYRRFGCTIDFDNALLFIIDEVEFVGNLDDRSALSRWINFALLHLEEVLKKLNESKRAIIKDHLVNAVDNVIKGARYERLESGGPKVPKVSKKTPLATQYFTDEINSHHNKDLIQIEESLFDESKSRFYMAHNGWVMGDDPLRNFAEQDSWVYLRRELVCWGDSVKLRYGSIPDDSPFLWDFMEKYVTQMASAFQGLRLDNCHSTPIHVAKYMIDSARRVNPDLYLIAELFTANEGLDNIFVNKLGIISLIREAMSSSSPYELQRQVHRFGGQPVGSFVPDNLKTGDNSKEHLYMRPFMPTVAHAIFFDLTHDNPSPLICRTPYDPLASAALVSMTYSAIGSNRGLDELVPHHIHVVDEERQYNVWNEKDGVDAKTGLIQARKALNGLHQFLATHGYSQSYVDKRDRDTVVVTRHNAKTHKSIILAARTAFYPLHEGYSSSFAPFPVDGKLEKILFEMKMTGQPEAKFEKDAKIINGYRSMSCQVHPLVEPEQSEMIQVHTADNVNYITLKNFPPSSVLVLSTSLLDNQTKALEAIQKTIQQYDDVSSEIVQIVSQLSTIDLNYVIFRSDQEEKDETGGHGVYSLKSGPLVYCGLAGIMSYLTKIRTHNDLGHPLCDNLRQGDWLLTYIVARLKRRPNTVKLAQWLENVFQHLSGLPRYLIPRYFDTILLPLYSMLTDRIWSLTSEFVRHGDNFVQRLAFGGLALIGSHTPSPLPPLAPQSIPALFAHLSSEQLPTIAAGLPHFASGYMRNWGRDTFIALKGLTLLTGQDEVAKIIILGFGGTLRHGLIPNLLDGGRNSRYNCRDAVWWWLQAIKDYIQTVQDGHKILDEQVRRIFPTDASPALINESDKLVLQPLHQTIQEALTRHFEGIDFIERNAGSQIDAHMTAEGFHIKIGVDRETGFVYGGNQWNCGTWMDKMGSSGKANNRGHPATPRDGSAVEIVGLCKSVVTFLAEMHSKNMYPYEGVKLEDASKQEMWTYEQWANKIQNSFEAQFYVGDDNTDSNVNRRHIYKDTVGASKHWMDFQLRPNFLVTMCVAHELFDREHAVEALEIVDNVLRGPLGMKTLDPSDWNYRGDYDNSNDTDDYNVANGFNYHNGPEWLWPTGFYFMARLKFITNHAHEISLITQLLSNHYEHLIQSEWFGLPELTNSNGSPCPGSCPIQAWSHSTLLELLHLKNFIERNMIFD